MPLVTYLARTSSHTAGLSTTSIHRLRLGFLQASVSRPAIHFNASARAILNVDHDRKASVLRKEREEFIAHLDSLHGTGHVLRKYDEYVVKSAKPPPGHKYWSLTILRCTYKDDDAWSQLLNLFEEEVRESTEFYGAPELMESLNFKAHTEEPSALEGASKALVRQKFLVCRASDDAEGNEMARQEVSPS